MMTIQNNKIDNYYNKDQELVRVIKMLNKLFTKSLQLLYIVIYRQ